MNGNHWTMNEETCCQFIASYECSRHPAVKALERDVLGCDYGGTSWTTREQAGQIADSLELDSNTSLLEIGCGSGWPGLFLSESTGCSVTLLDLPFNALTYAAERTRSDGISERVGLINASAEALPFADNAWRRLSHSDVLCCLPGKQRMLDECRRVASDDALMHFSVIQVAADTPDSEYDRLVEAGPPFIEVSPGYEQLLRESGWEVLECIDVTATYARSLEILSAGLAERPELQEVFGTADFLDTRERREEQLVLARLGWLQRLSFLVRAA